MTNHNRSKSTQDLLLINILSAALIAAVILAPDSPLRTALGIPFVFFFPGYTLVCALFPAKPDLGGIERLALSLGLSLAVVPLFALGLNYSPWGIRLAPTITSLYVFTILMSLLTFYRRDKLPTEQKFAPLMSIKLPKWGVMRRFDKLFIVGILAAVVLVASLTSYIAAAPKIGEQFTEFYVLGINGKLADYPVNLTLGQNGTVILGITNHEHEKDNYRIEINLENHTLANIDNIQLDPEENWNQNYTFTPDKTGNHMKLEFQLYKDAAEPYRSLQLWVTVKPGQ